MRDNNNKFRLIKCCPRFLCMVIFLLVRQSGVNAQTRQLSLKEAIHLGLANSKTLKLSGAKISQAMEQLEQAKDKFFPAAETSAGYHRSEIPANKLTAGNTMIALPRGRDSYISTLSIGETIWQGGKLHYAKTSAELLSQITQLDAADNKDGVIYNIISQYINLYKVIESQKVVARNLSLIDDQIRQSKRFFDKGLVTKNDVLRFKLQRSDVELNGVELEANRKVINYNLDISLGLPESTILDLAAVETDVDQQKTEEAYLDTALQERNELRQLNLRKKVADINLKDVRANLLPTLSGSVNGYYLALSANPFPNKGNYLTPFLFGLNFSWSLSAVWTNKHKTREAEIMQHQVADNRDITIDQIKNDVYSSYQQLIMSRSKIDLLRTSIDQAVENNNIYTSKYKSNVASAVDKADAETLLYQAQINLELAMADANLAYYTLIKSTGTLSKLSN